MFPSSRTKVLGKGLVTIAVEISLGLIPVYGPVLAPTFQVLNLIRETLAQEKRQLSDKQIAGAVASLTEREISEIVDEQISVTVRAGRLDQLSADQVAEFRRRLIESTRQLSTSLDEAAEREQARRAGYQEVRRDIRLEARRGPQPGHLVRGRRQALLAKLISEENWAAARHVVLSVIELGGMDRDIRRAERLTFLRCGPGSLAVLVHALSAFPAVLVIIAGLVYAGEYGSVGALALAIGTAACFLGGFLPQFRASVRYGLRKLLTIVPYVSPILLFIVLAVQQNGQVS